MYIRKSFEDRGGQHLLNEERGLSYTTSYAHPPKPDYQRGRYSSNEKKYDYQCEIHEPREVRPRTPSAG